MACVAANLAEPAAGLRDSIAVPGGFESPVRKPKRQDSAEISTDDDLECAPTPFSTASSSSSLSSPSRDPASISPLLLPEAAPHLDDKPLQPLKLDCSSTDVDESVITQTTAVHLQRSLKLDDVRMLRKFVRTIIGAKGNSTRSDKLLLRRGFSRCMLDVARVAAIAAASSESLSYSRRAKAMLQDRINASILRCRNAQALTAKGRLGPCIRKWRAEKTHDPELIRQYSTVCRQEALNVLHNEIARTKVGSNRTQARKDQFLKARLADLRAEMASDLCTYPEIAADLNNRNRNGDKAADAQFSWRSSGYKGVNLGGWLLWEPGPADGTPLVQALPDTPACEWSLCEELTKKYGCTEAEAIIRRHRATHVTREDFVEIAKTGANSIRIPFGYWVITGPREGEPFIGPGTEFIDAALEWARELGLSIVLCLHGCVGFQSTEPPCGKANDDWTPDQLDIAASVDVLRQVVERWGQHSSLAGICAMNEPHGDIPAAMLNEYFREAYFGMRNAGLPESVQVILPIFHQDFKDHAGIYTEGKGFVNVVFDAHMYQVFGEPYAGWRHMSLAQHLRFATAHRSRNTNTCKVIAEAGERVIVTEFCLEVPTWHNWSLISKEYDALTEKEKFLLRRCYAIRQLKCFSEYGEGWFFWCWRDDAAPQWSYRESFSCGWFPRPMDDDSPVAPLRKRQRTTDM